MQDNEGIVHGDGILRFLVPSRSHSGETHLVDLGVPTCSCRWHQTAVGPALRRGERPRKYCHHVLAARRVFTDWAIEQFRNADPNYAQEK